MEELGNVPGGWYPKWTGYGRPGKHTPIPGEALCTYECLACGQLLSGDSDPEEACPKYRPPLTYSKSKETKAP